MLVVRWAPNPIAGIFGEEGIEGEGAEGRQVWAGTKKLHCHKPKNAP